MPNMNLQLTTGELIPRRDSAHFIAEIRLNCQRIQEPPLYSTFTSFDLWLKLWMCLVRLCSRVSGDARLGVLFCLSLTSAMASNFGLGSVPSAQCCYSIASSFGATAMRVATQCGSSEHLSAVCWLHLRSASAFSLAH